MSIKQEIQNDNNRLDHCQRQLSIAKVTKNAESMAALTTEIKELTARIENNKKQHKTQLSDKAQNIVKLAFNRPLLKEEQADLGKLKKSVRGLVVVHPMTALGKEIGVTVITGYAPKKF
jgi:ribosome-associated protein